MSFAMENGAHVGPGKEETSGFLMIPESVGSPQEVIRRSELRDLVFRLFDSAGGKGCEEFRQGLA